MIDVKVVLFVLSTLAPYDADRDEDPAARRARLTPAAESIASEARTYEEGAALIALGEAESHFARYVMEGRCLDGPRHARCDLDPRSGLPRAVGPWQVWHWCTAAHAAAAGSREQLQAGARCAARHWRSARLRCIQRNPDVLAGAFSGYRGASCEWRPAERRAKRTRELLTLMLKKVGSA